MLRRIARVPRVARPRARQRPNHSHRKLIPSRPAPTPSLRARVHGAQGCESRGEEAKGRSQANQAVRQVRQDDRRRGEGRRRSRSRVQRPAEKGSGRRRAPLRAARTGGAQHQTRDGREAGGLHGAHVRSLRRRRRRHRHRGPVRQCQPRGGGDQERHQQKRRQGCRDRIRALQL